MSSNIYLVAAKRTAICVRNGHFKHLQAHELLAPILKQILIETDIAKDQVDSLIMGNGLYAGGNPARLAALLAGLPDHIPAITLDSQCCGGMDSLTFAAAQIKANMARAILVGGLESYSRAPKRFKRALTAQEIDQEYSRPPFTPWPTHDPDMLDAATALAKKEEIPRSQQEDYAILSHQRAMNNRQKYLDEIVPIDAVQQDQFTRFLSKKICARLPSLTGAPPYDLTATTVAVEADGAAAILIINQEIFDQLPITVQEQAVLYRDSLQIGGNPTYPAATIIPVTQKILQKNNLHMHDIAYVELMEAFAVQPLLFKRIFDYDLNRINPQGGALARGHPIGASGTVNIVRLFHQLRQTTSGAYGLATIAAAGGLGSAILLEKK